MTLIMKGKIKKYKSLYCPSEGEEEEEEENEKKINKTKKIKKDKNIKNAKSDDDEEEEDDNQDSSDKNENNNNKVINNIDNNKNEELNILKNDLIINKELIVETFKDENFELIINPYFTFFGETLINRIKDREAPLLNLSYGISKSE